MVMNVSEVFSICGLNPTVFSSDFLSSFSVFALFSSALCSSFAGITSELLSLFLELCAFAVSSPFVLSFSAASVLPFSSVHNQKKNN